MHFLPLNLWHATCFVIGNINAKETDAKTIYKQEAVSAPQGTI